MLLKSLLLSIALYYRNRGIQNIDFQSPNYVLVIYSRYTIYYSKVYTIIGYTYTGVWEFSGDSLQINL
jgi:hypothetical protein